MSDCFGWMLFAALGWLELAVVVWGYWMRGKLLKDCHAGWSRSIATIGDAAAICGQLEAENARLRARGRELENEGDEWKAA